MITDNDINGAWGEGENADQIADIEPKNTQFYAALQQLTSNEPFDLVMNSTKGNGLEAWRKTCRRYDPATGARKRNLLRLILNPCRSTLDNLAQSLERWEDQ
eukprot:1331707-Pyramimonas_sp.AAC.1